MDCLKVKLLEKFQGPVVGLLLPRLGVSVRQVCNQIISPGLQDDEIEDNLEKEIDEEKLRKGIAEADGVELQWFVDTIAALIKDQVQRRRLVEPGISPGPQPQNWAIREKQSSSSIGEIISRA